MLLTQRKTITEACKQLGVTDRAYHRRRKEYGGKKVDKAKPLQELEVENARVERAFPARPGLEEAVVVDLLKNVQIAAYRCV